MKKIASTSLTALSLAAAMALAACGGGGGDSGSASTPSNGSGPTPPQQTVTSGNVSTPQYAANSMQLAAFNLLNQYRQQCGFPALTENTFLDQAAQNHAQYLGLNGVAITDTESSTNAGFTGVTYTDRAVKAGFVSGASVGGVSGGYYTNATLSQTQYGEQLAYDWMSGVYHIGVAAWPVTEVGIGFNQTTYNGYPEIQATLSFANEAKTITSNGPITFPCQGTAGVAYSAGGETPLPPNTSGNWGTPIAIAGNLTDTIVLLSATLTPVSGGSPLNLQLLDSANDPNKLLPAYQAVAYPTTPLSPNTAYSVSISGTVNGTPFSRNFTFTTGNVIG
ncbi:TPA: CAP domain-containing protein [Burkholderia vietnamiensis]|nr:CAP domain-containing protein [Burkholderia vietnamiensis]